MTQNDWTKLEPGALERALRACRRGDEHAARLLYASVTPGLRAHARSILRDDNLAEDAVQSAMHRMMSISPLRIARVRDARAWLSTLVRREALMLLRSNRRRCRRELQRSADTPSTVATLGSSISHEQLTRAMDALPRKVREVLVLKHVVGLTFDQIAVSTGLNRNTAAGMHRRGIIRLQEQLTRNETKQTQIKTEQTVNRGTEHHA